LSAGDRGRSRRHVSLLGLRGGAARAAEDLAMRRK
jgi:hypothetical protein